ncbi:MAG: site-specific integrase [Clostridia bacterium]|jgi:integrase|nr:site-specific integrase [Clostridia bacterium]
MERVKTAKTKMEKETEYGKKGQVHVRNKKNGKEARVTLQLNIAGVSNPRLSRYGSTEEIAKKRLAEAILLTYIEVQKNYQLANRQVFSPECQAELEKFDEYMDCIKKNQLQLNQKSKQKEYKIGKESIYAFVQKMLKQKKRQSEKKGTRKKKKLSPKTVTFYKGVADAQVIPIFGEMNAITITQEEIEDKLETLDCSTKYLKDIKLVLKMSFDVVIKEKLRKDNPAEKIEIYNDKKSLGIEIEHLEQDRQEVWLDIFEKDKRQASYLYETILLTGARPEEGCGFKWTSMDYENDIVHIHNAYKDWEIYDDNMEKIGHKRGDGELKTPESYRDIPMHPRLKRLLLMIKAERMEEYKKLGKVWDENDYIFLNEKGNPFVPQDLTRKMPYFIKKYNLEHLTVYGLRHSFATLCSTFGMPPEVLHVIMGHSDFETTRRYYIHITGERKKNEMIKLYIKQNGEETLKQLINESDMYFGKIKLLKIQDIRPEERLAG